MGRVFERRCSVDVVEAVTGDGDLEGDVAIIAETQGAPRESGSADHREGRRDRSHSEVSSR